MFHYGGSLTSHLIWLRQFYVALYNAVQTGYKTRFHRIKVKVSIKSSRGKGGKEKGEKKGKVPQSDSPGQEVFVCASHKHTRRESLFRHGTPVD